MTRLMKQVSWFPFALICSLMILLAVDPVHASSGQDPTIATLPVDTTVISSAEIIEHARDLDGKILTFEGEVIGDIMSRGDHIWINVSDGVNAIGLWITEDQAKHVTVAGKYDLRGDRVRIVGRFNKACPEHGGDYDIHPDTLVLLEKGYPIDHPVKPGLILTAIILFLGALVVLVLYRRQSHRSIDRWSVKLMMPADSRLRLR